MAIPPGPSPRVLAVKRPATVVVIVQPYSELEGARYLREGKTAAEYSKVTVAGTVKGQARSYEFRLTVEHIAALNAQLRRGDPLLVDLDHSDNPQFYEALDTERGNWSVEALLYYEHEKTVYTSLELGVLRVRNY